jgi:hypothetical protein
MRFTLLAATLVTLLAGRLAAEDAQPVELVLHPRAIEQPMLKYRLLPAEIELQPGNAVPILLRLPWEQMHWMNNVYPKLHEWEDRPLSAPEWQSFAGVLPDRFYDEMKRAAYRRDALWEYPIRETQTPYMILLPDVQGLRVFLGQGLSAKIRYHLTRGELDQAREAILVGLANTRHVAQTPFLVNQLVAAAIQRNMLDRTSELISQPGSPNLYWALSTLPDSLLELDRTASLEADLLAMTFPAVHDLDRPRDDREWRRMAAQLILLLQELGELPRDEAPKSDSLLGQLFQKLLPAENVHLKRFAEQGRAELPRLLGITEEAVAAMSDDQAAVRWYMHQRLSRDQHRAAVLALPPREAWPRLKLLQDQTRTLEQQTGGARVEFFDPVSMYVSTRAVNRRIAALRIVEAVRHHLAAERKLPQSLDEITAVPIPLDPLTGERFQWKAEGKTATIKAPPLPADLAPPGSTIDQNSRVEYRLSIR